MVTASKNLIIFGVGETAELAYEYFTHDSQYEVVAFSVSKEYKTENFFCGLPVVEIEEVLDVYPPTAYSGFVAVSSTKLNRIRASMFNLVVDLGYKMASYISSRCFIWHNVKVGVNCFIMENNVLQPFTEVEDNVVMWSGNHVGHRSLIKKNSFVSSHCVISGYCTVGESSFLGVNATLEDGVELGADSFVGAGTLIRKASIEKSFYQRSETIASKVTSHKVFRIKNEKS